VASFRFLGVLVFLAGHDFHVRRRRQGHFRAALELLGVLVEFGALDGGDLVTVDLLDLDVELLRHDEPDAEDKQHGDKSQLPQQHGATPRKKGDALAPAPSAGISAALETTRSVEHFTRLFYAKETKKALKIRPGRLRAPRPYRLRPTANWGQKSC